MQARWSHLCRKGITLPENDDPRLLPYRERFFNFYDEKMMDNAWFKVGGAL